MPSESDNAVVHSGRSEAVQSRREFLAGSVVATGVAAGAGVPDAGARAESVKKGAAVNPRLFTFVGGRAGGWSVISVKVIVGDALPAVDRVDIVNGVVATLPDGGKWALRGVTSNERYPLAPRRMTWSRSKQRSAAPKPTTRR